MHSNIVTNVTTPEGHDVFVALTVEVDRGRIATTVQAVRSVNVGPTANPWRGHIATVPFGATVLLDSTEIGNFMTDTEIEEVADEMFDRFDRDYEALVEAVQDSGDEYLIHILTYEG